MFDAAVRYAGEVRVREWDPGAASQQELETWRLLCNEMLAADMPGEPRWRAEGLRNFLAVTMPDEHRLTWICEDRNGRPLGWADLLLMDDCGIVGVYVCPDSRRTGAGRRLLAEAVNHAYVSGKSTLGVEIAAGTPGTSFYLAHGFQLTSIEYRSLLTLSTVDWRRLHEHSTRYGFGYRLEYFPGGPPPELLPAYATAKRAVQSGPELYPSSYSPERLAARLATLHDRGLTPHAVCATHNRTGVIAGLTEVVVPSHRPERADQYDTVVLPSHRGYGLGLAMKARMLLELRTAAPELRDVQTWTGLENEPMARVNAELGFIPNCEWYEFEADVSALARRLGLDAGSAAA